MAARSSCAAGAMLVATFISLAHGEAYIPDSDAVVLERLAAAPAMRQLEPLRSAVRRNPHDMTSALQLAQGYLAIGRETSDPRFISYAQATLAPWLQANPPAAVLVLQATALQSSHRFDEALALLDRALALEPRNAQAWLTKATLLQVQGDFDNARAACQRLLQSADHTIALTCRASVDSLTGRLDQSYQALQRVAHASPEGSADLSAWILGQLAEMAVRLGSFAAAEQHFRGALRRTPRDSYLQAAYADLLLLQDRNKDAIELLRDGASQDVLLLRLAIAARRAGAADASHWAQVFDARRRATRPDDNPHLREHARFLLDVADQPQAAVLLARKNWEIQREPADVALYLRAARRAGSATDEEMVRAWVAEVGYEDRTLAKEKGTASAGIVE